MVFVVAGTKLFQQIKMSKTSVSIAFYRYSIIVADGVYHNDLLLARDEQTVLYLACFYTHVWLGEQGLINMAKYT